MSEILNVDIIHEIIKQIETKDLFNWLLVSKFWSEIAVSFLWRNPVQHRLNNDKCYLIIKTYINCFNEKERAELKLLEKNKFDSQQTSFFEYGKYLKEFNLRKLEKLIFKLISFENKKEFTMLLVRSLMRQCQKLDSMDWNIFLADEDLFQTVQYKIKDLKNLGFYAPYCYSTESTN